ncbi:MAG: hypothetical protein LBH05_01570 [Deferribacteraceae bacterium]|jgi:hypothetical protein|nr:hypothetical protein [Deferribacteraceae bacterium]
MQSCYLSKQGYGSLAEITDLDTPEFLNALEYEYIVNAVTDWHIDKTGKR